MKVCSLGGLGRRGVRLHRESWKRFYPKHPGVSMPPTPSRWKWDDSFGRLDRGPGGQAAPPNPGSRSTDGKWGTGRSDGGLGGFLSGLFRCRSVQKLNLCPSCGFAVVVAEQASQTSPAPQFPRFTGSEVRLNELVLQPLVVPLVVVVGTELVDRSPERPFSHENQMIEALGLDRPDEPFRECGRLGRKTD